MADSDALADWNANSSVEIKVSLLQVVLCEAALIEVFLLDFNNALGLLRDGKVSQFLSLKQTNFLLLTKLPHYSPRGTDSRPAEVVSTTKTLQLTRMIRKVFMQTALARSG